ncbi:tumor necrosis factor receptor superfamily member 22-like isoform X2 [Myotis myotis]|uniref:tumor necrosis factor receptor superfamily member 22-like isoform X2 n=1 Tax=Myotis myotis TaxID=51298 RepID=UPI00174BDB57|nr:tumor necrosis factor receptor superfamily member 22-like isoform X2 [Myotis myotis]
MAGMSLPLLLLLLLLPLPPPPRLLLLGTPLTLSPSSNLWLELSAASLSPGSRCGPDEYWSGRRCCQRCPAGHYVHKPCSSPHTQSECEACDTGTYTGHANGLQSCLLCTICREDQEMVSDCTPKQDRRCQCKTGEFYCDSEPCPESCYRCTRCPEGKVVLQTCNATADTLCGWPGPGPGKRHRFCWMAGWLFAAVAGALVILCVRKPGDGGGRAACCCPHAGPVSTGRPYRRDSLTSKFEVTEDSGKLCVGMYSIAAEKVVFCLFFYQILFILVMYFCLNNFETLKPVIPEGISSPSCVTGPSAR